MTINTLFFLTTSRLYPLGKTRTYTVSLHFIGFLDRFIVWKLSRHSPTYQRLSPVSCSLSLTVNTVNHLCPCVPSHLFLGMFYLTWLTCELLPTAWLDSLIPCLFFLYVKREQFWSFILLSKRRTFPAWGGMLRRCCFSLDLLTCVNKHFLWWSLTNPDTDPLSLMITCQLSFAEPPQIFNLTSVHWFMPNTDSTSLTEQEKKNRKPANGVNKVYTFFNWSTV